MIRVYGSRKWRFPPKDDDGDYPLTDDRHRFAEPLVADGTEDDPDEFKVYDRIGGTEFPYRDESPQEAGARANQVEALLAETDDQVELIDGEN